MLESTKIQLDRYRQFEMHIVRTSQQVLIILILRNVPVDIRLQAKVKTKVKTLVVVYKYVKMSCVNNSLNKIKIQIL